MEVFATLTKLEEWAKGHGQPVALTIGFFDGLHRGHKHLISQLNIAARAHGAKSLAITFANAPRGFHQPEREWLYLTTPEEKLFLLEHTGVDAVLMLTYDASIAGQTARGFIESLMRLLPLKLLVAGYDSRLGNDQIEGRQAYLELTRSLRIDLAYVEALTEGDQPVKSRLVRDLVANGAMADARRVMGHPYFILERVVHGKGRGGQRLSVPTANMLIDREKLGPPTGVYACIVHVNGGAYGAATCVMSAEQAHRTVLERERRVEELPTDLHQVVVEAHLLDYDGDLYGRDIRIEFIGRIREWIDFENVEELKRQIGLDIIEVREILQDELVKGAGHDDASD